MYNYEETIHPTKDNFSKSLNQILFFPGIPPHYFLCLFLKQQISKNTMNLKMKTCQTTHLKLLLVSLSHATSTVGEVNKEHDTFSFYLIGVSNTYVTFTTTEDCGVVNRMRYLTFQNLIVLSLVDKRKRAPLAIWHHRILLIFSSISKLFK